MEPSSVRSLYQGWVYLGARCARYETWHCHVSAALLKAKAEKQSFGDVLLAVTVDEEVASEDGARFLVEQHPLLFENVRYAFSEFGGFNMAVGGKRFYPIQIAEKQVCPTRIIFRGAGGHGAYQARGGAMIELAKALQILNDHSLPVHITQPVQQMIGYFAKGLDGLTGPILRRLLNPLYLNSSCKLMRQMEPSFSPCCTTQPT
jgi:acetylornithine deacetylase/succinyl-diaminopimelate desuccinylase-like protein